MFNFASVDWFNYGLLVAMTPALAVYFYRVLTPRYSFWKTFSIVLLFVAILEALGLAFGQGTAVQNPLFRVGWFFISTSGYLLMIRRITRSPWAQILLFYGMWVVVMAFGFGLGSLANRFALTAIAPGGGVPEAVLNNMDVIFTEMFQLVLTLVVSDVVARRFRKIKVNVRLGMFATVLLSQSFAMFVIAAVLTWEDTPLSNTLLICIYFLLCAMTDVYILRVFRSMVQNAELEQRVALLNQQQALERARYEAAGEQMMNMRRFRHDYSNTLETIGTLLDMGNTERIRAILDSTAQSIAETRIVYTGNETVDAVLYSKSVAAEIHGIELRTSLLWPAGLSASDADLMRIFANLLDNAIRYCETLPEGVERRIEIMSAQRGQMFLISFSNPYLSDTPPEISAQDEESPFETHGHGLAIVRAAAENCGGTLAISLSDGRLTFRVLLGISEA